MKSNSKYKINTLKYLLLLLIISFSVTAGNCDKILQNTNSVPEELVGNWLLVRQTGAQQDICPGEIINFQSNGIAALNCPESDTITRNFTIENNILEYTESGISYSVDNLTYDSLSLLGSNVSRNLIYLKFTATSDSKRVFEKTDFINSSEIKK